MSQTCLWCNTPSENSLACPEHQHLLEESIARTRARPFFEPGTPDHEKAGFTSKADYDSSRRGPKGEIVRD